MAAQDFSAIIARIREVLTDGAVVVRRGIPVGQFRWTTGRDEPTRLPASAGNLPTVDVVIADVRDSEGTPGNESGDWWLLEIRAVVSVVYQFGGGNALPFPGGGERQSVLTRASNDSLRIRGVLSYPENLSRDAGGNDTGLCSGHLQYVGTEGEFLDSAYVARHTFLGRVEITPPV